MFTSLFLTLLLVLVSNGEEKNSYVNTPLGAISGTIRTSFGGRKFAAFKGIPYAKPPIGERRFEPAEPMEPWSGVWNASHPTECPQLDMFNQNMIIGNEDCLHINVYVPNHNPNSIKNLDVVVIIHGGAYMLGSGHMFVLPEYLMDRDIILVTLNYRLGILGFLSTEDEVVPGNNGMKDQVLALKWVQKNIASFGGNPDSVTITGISAGGSSVHLHYFSEMSKGLFHRGYSSSGVALNPWSLQKGALEKTRQLAGFVGCPTSSNEHLIRCLKQRPFKQLLDKTELFYGYKLFPLGPFVPVVEKSSKPFLKAHPYEMLINGDVLDVPWINAIDSHEGYMPQFFSLDDGSIDKNWDQLAPILLDFNYTLDKSSWSSTSQIIKKYYFGEEKIDERNGESFAQMIGDRLFSMGSEQSVKIQSKVVNSPIYYYYFSYAGDSSKYVVHGSEAKYLYGPTFMPTPLSNNELKMREILLNMLTTYAKTGTPVIDGVEWKPTKGDELTYLNIKSDEPHEMSLETTQELTPIRFWKSLGLLENENLLFVKDEL